MSTQTNHYHRVATLAATLFAQAGWTKEVMSHWTVEYTTFKQIFPTEQSHEGRIYVKPMSPNANDEEVIGLEGEFMSRGENALRSTHVYLIESDSDEVLTQKIQQYIQDADIAINQSYAMRVMRVA